MKIGLIPAAGMARRLGIASPKELLEFEGRAVIDYSVDNLLGAGVNAIAVVIREGKEAIRDHIHERYPDAPIEFVFQSGAIGNLLDAIKASYAVIKGHDVYFCMADTVIRPNPFNITTMKDLTLLCFSAAADEWKHFGVIDLTHHRLVDKPNEYISSVCWGALIWRPRFTERLMTSHHLPDVINDVDWDYSMTITEYIDIGIGMATPSAQAARSPSSTVTDSDGPTNDD